MVCFLAFFEMRRGKGQRVRNTSIVVFQDIRIPRSVQTNEWEYHNQVYHAQFVHIVRR